MKGWDTRTGRCLYAYTVVISGEEGAGYIRSSSRIHIYSFMYTDIYVYSNTQRCWRRRWLKSKQINVKIVLEFTPWPDQEIFAQTRVRARRVHHTRTVVHTYTVYTITISYYYMLCYIRLRGFVCLHIVVVVVVVVSEYVIVFRPGEVPLTSRVSRSL